MDSFELNKIAGAVLGTLMFAVGLNILAGMLFTVHPPAVPGYDLPQAAEGADAGAGAAPQAPAEPLPVLLAKADAAKGEKAVAKCKACHSFEKGGPNKIGPDLFGVVGRPIAGHEGFNYSQALKAFGAGGKWDFEKVNLFITNPKKDVPGTLMNFAGVSKPEERADILVYLNSLSDSPQPLPKPEAAPAGDAAPAAGAAPAPAAPAPAGKH
jgi:cytochrome c